MAITPVFGLGGQIEEKRIIDVTDVEALLVRRNNDGGNVLYVDTSNRLTRIAAGSGTSMVRVGGRMSMNTNAVGTDANTTKKTLQTYTLPANSFSGNQKSIRISAWGTTAANGNGKAIALEFGSTILHTFNGSYNNLAWTIQAIVARTASSAQDAIASHSIGSAEVGNTHTEPSSSTSSGMTVRVTGQNSIASANDIVAEGMLIEFLN